MVRAGYCEVCGSPFVGGNRRKFCSMRCKRCLEAKRKVWDHLDRVERHLRKAAAREDIPMVRREEFSRRADALSARIGDRP